MVKFSEDLWDGFDVVAGKTELGLQVVKDISDFLKKRAALEQEYAKNLAALCKTAPGSAGLFSKGPLPVEKETKTLKAALLSIQEEGSRAAVGHQEFANKVLNDVVKPLEAFVKTKENDRKKVVTDGQKRAKALQEAKAAAEKTKDAYMKAMKEAEVATEAHDKAKTELSSNADNKKFQEAEKRAAQKAGPLNDKAKAAEPAYQKAVDAANEAISKTFSEYLPPILDALQQLEEERYSQLRTALVDYLAAQRAIPSHLDERCQEIDKAITALETDADLAEYVDSNKSPTSGPEQVRFVSYKEPAQPAATTTTTTTTTSEKEDTPAGEASKPSKEEDDLF